MAQIITRAGKGASLSHVEVDANFTNLNNAYSTIFVINTLTLTNQALAELELANSQGSSTILQDTLGRFNKMRLTCRVTTLSASASIPRLYAQYSLDATTWVTIGSGAGADVISLASIGQKATGWLDLPAGALGNDVYFRIAMAGGDAVADPVVRGLCYQFEYA